MALNIRPRQVEVRNSEGLLSIEWSDGHHSVYPLYGLRKNCPCVMCRGGHENMGDFDRSLFFLDPPFEYQIEDIDQVGNHAVRIYWNDGHSTGMYQWETLRKLCPCDECYPEQE